MAAADNITVKIEVNASDLVEACIKALTEDGTLTEVVRCKDCKHRDPEDKICDCGHFIRWQLPRQDDWFCADGERREDG